MPNEMLYDNKRIVEELYSLVEETCRHNSSYEIWLYHIVPVIKFSKSLALKLSADIEIVEISALLHDYAGIKDSYEEHHINGAKYAEEILKNLGYPECRIEKIKHCIIAHRASENILRETLEAEIIACADSMAHFDNINLLFYYAFVSNKLNVEEGTKWVIDKLDRNWKKLMPEAKEMLVSKNDCIKSILSIT